ncbi:MAG: ComEC/Rec2 family competence protein, partial [Gammaproteobacteria bacterium]
MRPLSVGHAPRVAWLRRLDAWIPPWPSAVLLAALAVHRLPSLAPASVCAVLIALGIVLLVASRQDERQGLRFLALFVAAVGWTMLRADMALGERLVPSQEGVDFTVQGYVSGMPRAVERGDLFMFHVERCVGPSASAGPPCPADREIRLGWYRAFGAPPPDRPSKLPSVSGPQPGERWQLTVRLKRPHALLNPYAFDAELRSLEEGVSGTGAVRATRDT